MQTTTHPLPAPHQQFLAHALERLKDDDRLVGVTIGGSYLARTMDAFSDVDLVIAVEPADHAAVMAERQTIAASLGSYLAGFTGEHVGEPRVLICLYGPPLLHVDLKFVSLEDAADRVEDAEILWARDDRLPAVLARQVAHFPQPDMQWIEDRFWVWVHYGAAKIGRGELFEAIGFLAFLRDRALGPLALQSRGALPTGVRKLEVSIPELQATFAQTVPTYDATSCANALRTAAELYQSLRNELAGESLLKRDAAEQASMDYLDEIARSVASGEAS